MDGQAGTAEGPSTQAREQRGWREAGRGLRVPVVPWGPEWEGSVGQKGDREEVQKSVAAKEVSSWAPERPTSGQALLSMVCLSFDRGCAPAGQCWRAQCEAEPLPALAAVLQGSRRTLLSPPAPCSGALQLLRSLGTTEAGEAQTQMPRPL